MRARAPVVLLLLCGAASSSGCTALAVHDLGRRAVERCAAAQSISLRGGRAWEAPDLRITCRRTVRTDRPMPPLPPDAWRAAEDAQ